MIFFCCFPLSHWAYLPKITFLLPKVWIWPLGPLLPFLKGPPNSSKTKIFKNNNFFCFTLSHWVYLPKIMFLSPKLRLLAIKGPLGPLRALFKGPLNSSRTKIKKKYNFFCCTLSHWAYLPKIMFLSPKLRLLASKSKIFKLYIFSYIPLSHWASIPRDYVSMPTIMSFGF